MDQDGNGELEFDEFCTVTAWRLHLLGKGIKDMSKADPTRESRASTVVESIPKDDEVSGGSATAAPAAASGKMLRAALSLSGVSSSAGPAILCGWMAPRVPFQLADVDTEVGLLRAREQKVRHPGCGGLRRRRRAGRRR